MYWRKNAKKAFTLVELLVVIGIIALLIAILMPALSRARKQALQASCGSNARQVTYGALAYANDWKEQLPTRMGVATPGLQAWLHLGLATFARLPIIGFDTVTVWDWASFRIPVSDAYGHCLGGLAFVMRDYLKNDMDVYTCPDGYYTKNDWVIRWDGCIGYPPCMLGPWDTSGQNWGAAGGGGWGPGGGLMQYRTGYLWLPHRLMLSFSSPGGCSGTVVPDQDTPGDIAKTASDLPSLLIMADFNLFTSRREDHCAGVDPGGCGVGANHNATSYRQLLLPRSDCAPRVFPPNIGREEIPQQMPLGRNQSRIDARTTWVPWQDWEYYKHEWSGGYAGMYDWYSF